MVRRLKVALLLALLLTGCVSTRPDMPALKPTEDPGTAVAKITFPTGSTEYVSRTEFEQARDKILQGQAPEAFVLDYVVSRHLMLQEARAKDVTADPQEVDQFVESIRSQTCPQLPIPEAQGESDPAKLFDACARFFGFDGGAAFRRYLQEEIAITKLVPGEELHTAHILLKTEEEAQKARERVTTGGEDFGTVAKELSIDPSAKQNSGDLGFNPPGQLVPPFEQAAAALKDGEVSQPVQTEFGWHIIKAIERRKAERPSAEAVNAYRQTLLQQAKDDGRVQYLITPAPAPTPIELPTVDVGPEETATPAAEGPDQVATPTAEGPDETATPEP
ncbi:MAG: peptidylprolyl isomerase [Chloroflexota bacterium]|nr:peptidylprolyl isomerase [Chloroflexota bacterium]